MGTVAEGGGDQDFEIVHGGEQYPWINSLQRVRE